MTIDLVTLTILALATYRISRLLVEDVIAEDLRNLVWERFPPESTKLGYLFTCYWCTSPYIASLLVVCYMIVPMVTVPVALIFALSALAGIISTRLDR